MRQVRRLQLGLSAIQHVDELVSDEASRARKQRISVCVEAVRTSNLRFAAGDDEHELTTAVLCSTVSGPPSLSELRFPGIEEPDWPHQLPKTLADRERLLEHARLHCQQARINSSTG